MSDLISLELADIRKRLKTLESLEVGNRGGARVYNSADIALANTTAVVLTFNSERYDDAAFHSTSSNTSRFTIPVSGRYAAGASVVFASNATGFREAWLLVNGTTRIADMLIPAVSGISTRITLAGVEWEFTAGDYLEVFCYQNSGGSLNITAASAYSPEFWIHAL